MGWPFRAGRTVTVHRSTVNPRTQDRSTPETHELEWCAWDPGSTSETRGADGTTVVTKPRVFAAYDADVLDTDEFSIAGVPGMWEVAGDILRWRNDLTTTEACSEIPLTRKRGAK